MPFVQMENISHFLRACQSPPINLPPHDVFLTVDLYEKKDPAQVLQCLDAFSRKAHIVKPERFQTAIRKSKTNAMSPQNTGTNHGAYSYGTKVAYQRDRGTSNASESSTSTYNASSRNTGGRASPTKTSGTASPTGGVSSWSKRSDENTTMPAWNTAQYGWMGGASQGNQGITFGGRRQITTPAPKIPSLAEKERKRREEEAEAERLQVLAEEAEHKRRVEREAEEERDRVAEERRWKEETRKEKEREKMEAEEEKRKWEEEERKWKEEEAREKELEAQLEKERQRTRVGSDARLTGQFLSQYQAEQRQLPKVPSVDDPQRIAERQRVKDLERQLEEAKKREQEYERERQARVREGSIIKDNVMENKHQTLAPGVHNDTASHTVSEEDSWQANERDYLRQAWRQNTEQPPHQPPRPLPTPNINNPLISPTSSIQSQENQPPLPARPLPDPSTYSPAVSRTDRFLQKEPAPLPTQPKAYIPSEASHSTTSEQDAETARRLASQTKTKAGGWASKSLLEREMEMERQRQREWEESQKATKEAVQKGIKDGGTGPGESWDVHQYGYLGGDSQNRVGPGLGGRRQIIGPRPKP